MYDSYCHYCENSVHFTRASNLSKEWYSGKQSALYKLACNTYQEWTVVDIKGMISEFEEIYRDGIDQDILEAIDALKVVRDLLLMEGV